MIYDMEVWEILLLAGVTALFFWGGWDPRKEYRRFKRFLRFLARDLSGKK